MTSKQRMLTAIKGGIPDRLPATTHHVMQYFLDKYMGGISRLEFFDYFGLDPISWELAYKPDKSRNEFYEPEDTAEFLQSRMILEKSSGKNSAMILKRTGLRSDLEYGKVYIR